jgi:hypothetical protein
MAGLGNPCKIAFSMQEISKLFIHLFPTVGMRLVRFRPMPSPSFRSPRTGCFTWMERILRVRAGTSPRRISSRGWRSRVFNLGGQSLPGNSDQGENLGDGWRIGEEAGRNSLLFSAKITGEEAHGGFHAFARLTHGLPKELFPFDLDDLVLIFEIPDG